MRKRNKCGLFLSLCMAVAWTTQAQTSADGYVIAVEGDDVYIDLAEGKIENGVNLRSRISEDKQQEGCVLCDKVVRLVIFRGNVACRFYCHMLSDDF